VICHLVRQIEEAEQPNHHLVFGLMFESLRRTVDQKIACIAVCKLLGAAGE
jgi:hypothetical protein